MTFGLDHLLEVVEVEADSVAVVGCFASARLAVQLLQKNEVC